MNKATGNIIIGAIGLGGVGFLIYYLLRKKKKSTSQNTAVEQEASESLASKLAQAKYPTTLMPRMINKPVINLESLMKPVVVTTPTRKFELKDEKRKRFLDEWVAEEDGKQSILDYQKRSKTGFTLEDKVHLYSKHKIDLLTNEDKEYLKKNGIKL
jgi:hypothetical protein